MTATVHPTVALLPPTCSFDAIIVGTSLPASLLSAALSFSNSSVLHLDPNAFYSSTSATLSVSEISQLVAGPCVVADAAEGCRLPPVHSTIATRFGPSAAFSELPKVALHASLFPNGARLLHPHAKTAPLDADMKRRVMIDLMPCPVMAGSDIVEILAMTNAGHYVDFKAMDGLFVEFGKENGGLQKVPGSRADVFRNGFIDMVEKRLLMRFLKECYEKGEESKEVVGGQETESFEEMMERMGLSEKLKTFFRWWIANVGEGGGEGDGMEGMGRVRKFQQGMIKYGTQTPYLWGNYGSGELGQALCRVSAVHGGVFVLRRGILGVVTGEGGKGRGVVTMEGEVVEAGEVFVGREWVERERARGVEKGGGICVWRFCGVVDGGVVAGVARGGICVPAGEGRVGVRIWWVDSGMHVCPEGMFVVYAETVGGGEGKEEDLMAGVGRYVELMAEDNIEGDVGGDGDGDGIDNGEGQVRKVRLMWGITYRRGIGGGQGEGESGFTGVGGERDDYDGAGMVAEAKRCFAMLHPVEDFFRVKGEEEKEEKDSC